MTTTEPIRNKHQVQKIMEYYLINEQPRNYVLTTLSVFTALRVSDLLRLRWKDVYDFDQENIRHAFSLIEQKTRKPKIVTLNPYAEYALSLYIAQNDIRPEGFVIENPRTGKAISRIQAYQIIRAAAEALGIGRFACHSLRKTFGYHAWKRGFSPTVIMDIYNHSSYAVTQRYLGVSQDDRDEIYMNLDFSA
ncbi:MAG: tyrosine-type recombinase/integrase [Peptococcaceae bacterium]|jgi:integrase|nr:tyrosine-type recombinase/integrase [Peptococcaceae bacterium]